jgi:hypothetical protein
MLEDKNMTLNNLLSMVRENNLAAVSLYVGRGIRASAKCYKSRISTEITFTINHSGPIEQSITFSDEKINELYKFSIVEEEIDSGSLLKVLTNPVTVYTIIEDGKIEVRLTVVCLPYDRLTTEETGNVE